MNILAGSATCIFPSSSSVPGYSPTSTGAGSTPSSGSSVLNTYNPAGSNSVFGSDNPTGTVSNAISLSISWTSLLFVLTIACISCNI
ncbi:hypothetical protein B296_00058491 [Ensete ventricosum]|uniref:Uncharacterized protein n=1 Tax=Ensete ventricosum TaxID=4639 RepID=A0A426X7F1_ENSVE|nr:hypothetical protein B296_00058491 [Ensete ventricosum]